ncbi:hypothetical protein D3C78_1410610 [compost metagenome]
MSFPGVVTGINLALSLAARAHAKLGDKLLVLGDQGQDFIRAGRFTEFFLLVLSVALLFEQRLGQLLQFAVVAHGSTLSRTMAAAVRTMARRVAASTSSPCSWLAEARLPDTTRVSFSWI